MPNKHFCQGPECHTQCTTDRFLKSKGIIRGRYARINMDYDHRNSYYGIRDKYFCSQGCESMWLSVHMESIARRTLPPFIEHRRISEGYEKATETHYGRNFNTIRKIGVDNNAQ
tara:strand:- start:348 stop:689 length:342 start_codon:yes stop_codon:yes gene_type:complete